MWLFEFWNWSTFTITQCQRSHFFRHKRTWCSESPLRAFTNRPHHSACLDLLGSAVTQVEIRAKKNTWQITEWTWNQRCFKSKEKCLELNYLFAYCTQFSGICDTVVVVPHSCGSYGHFNGERQSIQNKRHKTTIHWCACHGAKHGWVLGGETFISKNTTMSWFLYLVSRFAHVSGGILSTGGVMAAA